MINHNTRFNLDVECYSCAGCQLSKNPKFNGVAICYNYVDGGVRNKFIDVICEKFIQQKLTKDGDEVVRMDER